MGLVPQRRVFTEHLSIISCPLFFWKRKAEKIGCEGRGIFEKSVGNSKGGRGRAGEKIQKSYVT